MEDASPIRDAASTSSASASASGSGATLATLQVGETCSYLMPDTFTGCRPARPCDSCLAIDGCMVADTGRCVSTTEVAVDPSEDYRLAITERLVLPNATANGTGSLANQRWQFPAGSIKYCGMEDSVCRSCTRFNFWRARGTYPDSRFCLGENEDCVCVDVCERRWYVQEDCSDSAFTPSPSNMRLYYGPNDNFGERIWHAVVGAIVFVAVVLLILIRSRRSAEIARRRELSERRERNEARRTRRTARATALGVNSLNLSGWESHRRDLIDKEIAFIHGSGGDATVAAAQIDEIDEYSSDSEDENDLSRRSRVDDAVYVRMDEERNCTEAAVASVQPSGTTVASVQPTGANGGISVAATPLPSLTLVSSTTSHRSSTTSHRSSR